MNCLILYTKKPNVIDFLPSLKLTLQKYAITFESFIIHPATDLSIENKKKIEELLPHTQFVICLGGDGTVLSAAHLTYSFGVPILPINFGQLGFIAENMQPERIDQIIKEVKAGLLIKEERTLLDICVCNNTQNQKHWIALNEAYIGSNNFHKIPDFSVTIDQHPVAHYKADGLIVCTATGSTGYNLSAGGPILYPSLDVFVLNAVIPHKINHRPIILSSSAQIRISIENEFSQNLIIDGQHKSTLNPHDCVLIEKSQYKVLLMYSPTKNYYDSLKEKLNWMV